MSRSRKDGRRGGAHRPKWGVAEVWSRRCYRVNMWAKYSHNGRSPDYKRVTRRYERRVARQLIQEEIANG